MTTEEQKEKQRTIPFPHAGIIVLVGPSNSGKTTLLRRLVDEGTLLQTEIVSSDDFRSMLGDTDFMDWKNRPREEADIIFNDYQLLSSLAFEAMNSVIAMRCRLGKLTVVDATHLQEEYRKQYLDLADKYNVPCMAWVLDVPEETLLERDVQREHPRGRQRVKQQYGQFKRSLRSVKDEGFASTYF